MDRGNTLEILASMYVLKKIISLLSLIVLNSKEYALSELLTLQSDGHNTYYDSYLHSTNLGLMEFDPSWPHYQAY